MIGTLMGIIFALIIAGVIWWALQEIMKVVPIAEPFRTLIRIVAIVILVIIVLWVAAALLGLAGIPVRTIRLG